MSDERRDAQRYTLSHLAHGVKGQLGLGESVRDRFPISFPGTFPGGSKGLVAKLNQIFARVETAVGAFRDGQDKAPSEWVVVLRRCLLRRDVAG